MSFNSNVPNTLLFLELHVHLEFMIHFLTLYSPNYSSRLLNVVFARWSPTHSSRHIYLLGVINVEMNEHYSIHSAFDARHNSSDEMVSNVLHILHAWVSNIKAVIPRHFLWWSDLLWNKIECSNKNRQFIWSENLYDYIQRSIKFQTLFKLLKYTVLVVIIRNNFRDLLLKISVTVLKQTSLVKMQYI